MPIVGCIGRDAGVSGVGGAGVCAQGARAARAGGVLAVDGSADAQGARAGSAAGGSIRKRGTPLRRLQPSQFGIVVLQRCRLQNSLPHWRCLRLDLPQAEADCAPHHRLRRSLPSRGSLTGKNTAEAAIEMIANRRAEHAKTESAAGGIEPAGTDFPA